MKNEQTESLLPDFGEIEKALHRLLNEIKTGFDKKDYDQIDEFITHGEYGLGLELLCGCIEGYKIRIEKRYYDEVERLGNAMEMESSDWQRLQKFIKKNQ